MSKNTETLARYVLELSFDDIPTEVVDAAKLFTLEAVGHMLSGLGEPVGQLVAGHVRSMGCAEQATVVGAGFRTAVAEAAYVNGTLAHTDELEAYGTLPGTGLVPPIAAGLAVGEWLGTVTGRDYLTALVAGIELQGRLGAAALGAPDRGFMGFSLVGTGGAVATAGRLLGLDVLGLCNGLGAALPLSGGSLRGCGYMAHVHEAGVPARIGVASAQLAHDGFTACPDILDGEHSWGDQYASGGRGYHPEALLDGLGESFFLQRSGAAPKKYGACGLTHLAIEGLIDLMVDHSLAPTDIESVDLVVPHFADRVAPFQEPTTGEQAKFSIRQAAAGLLVDGVPELPYVEAFTDAAAHDRRYAAARERVTVRTDPASSDVRSFTDQVVTVVLRDGSTRERTVNPLKVRGREENPLTVAERLDMFRRSAGRRLEGGAVERVVDVVMGWEDGTVADLPAVL